MDAETKIQQFKQMAEADPENDLGHFSLGKAYFDNGQFEEAIAPLTRVIELRPTTSKAYQLLGDSLGKTDNKDRAVETLTQGVAVADKQGDHMPLNAMVQLLKDFGAPVPEIKTVAPGPTSSASAGPSADGFKCARCGKPNGQLPKHPFKGKLGEIIYEHTCNTCWGEWIAMGTKVINELGIILSSEAGQKAYDQYMVEFLQLEEYHQD